MDNRVVEDLLDERTNHKQNKNISNNIFKKRKLIVMK